MPCWPPSCMCPARCRGTWRGRGWRGRPARGRPRGGAGGGGGGPPRRGGRRGGGAGGPAPPLPLARPRAGGRLAELRAGELRFTAEEAAVLLREATGADLPGPAVAALAARTEGWAAGLQLAALSLRGQADPAGFVAAFSGSHRYVLDYLAGEVLDRQPEEGRAFLLQTSVLERLSGGLGDAVTGRAGGQGMLY